MSRTPTRSRQEPTFTVAPAPRCKPDTDGLADPASTGFRLLCLDRAIAATPTDTKAEDVVKAAITIGAYLLGTHPLQQFEAQRLAAQAEAPTRQ